MRFDLHIHSNYSHDSNLSVDEILIQAVKKELDGVAICDHNTLAGSYHAVKRVKELHLPLMVIPGMEISTSHGHLLILGVREKIPPNLSPLETVRLARRNGGVVIAAHPFKIRGIGNVEVLNVDAVETFNSRCIFGENAKAKEMAHMLGKPEVGGSDSHLLATIGLGYTDIDAEPNEDAVLQAIREGKTRSCGKVTPLNIIVLLALRGLSRKFLWLRKKLHSKIFYNNGNITR